MNVTQMIKDCDWAGLVEYYRTFGNNELPIMDDDQTRLYWLAPKKKEDLDYHKAICNNIDPDWIAAFITPDCGPIDFELIWHLMAKNSSLIGVRNLWERSGGAYDVSLNNSGDNRVISARVCVHVFMKQFKLIQEQHQQLQKQAQQIQNLNDRLTALEYAPGSTLYRSAEKRFNEAMSSAAPKTAPDSMDED